MNLTMAAAGTGRERAPRHAHDEATQAVIRDAADLDAYLEAVASGNLGRVLGRLEMHRAAWLELAGPGAEEAWAFAAAQDLPLVHVPALEPVPDYDALFPTLAARRLGATPLRDARGYLAMAVDWRTTPEAIATLGFVTLRPVVVFVATVESRRWSGRLGEPDYDDREIAKEMGREPGGAARERARHAEELEERWTMLRIMRTVVERAVSMRASDIHIRPTAKSYEVLFRIDGNMVHQRDIIPELASLVVNRVKVFADLDIAEHRVPQDGLGTFAIEGMPPVDLRISVIPTVLGESVVVRLLGTAECFKTMDGLLLEPGDRREIELQMARSQGFFLATGPTGCGKSTTLYAMLQEIRTQPVNVMTVEDPVEYTLAGVRQVEVHDRAGLTFANALRGFLRHDPDVIMVGEIRDRETAGMAVESALTGHFVLSTLHTNTAATTVTRLLDLGVEAYLLRAALTGVLSQRLVKLNCRHCSGPEEVREHLRSALGVGPEEPFTAGRGCTECHGTGVSGRRVVYELLRITPAIRRLIEPGADADAIHSAALAEGMVPITAAAVALARKGLIPLAEAYRVRAD